MATYWAVVIVAVGTFTGLAAQDPDNLSPRPVVTVSGCIAQAQRTGSLNDDTGTGNIASPNTAGVEANSSEPVNAYVLLDALPVAARGTARGEARPTSYALQGLTSQLANHKGHRVETVGQLLPLLPAASDLKTPAGTIQRIAVRSVKMLATQCAAQQIR
jgi:hypothetical protein